MAKSFSSTQRMNNGRVHLNKKMVELLGEYYYPASMDVGLGNDILLLPEASVEKYKGKAKIYEPMRIRKADMALIPKDLRPHEQTVHLQYLLDAVLIRPLSQVEDITQKIYKSLASQIAYKLK